MCRLKKSWIPRRAAARRGAGLPLQGPSPLCLWLPIDPLCSQPQVHPIGRQCMGITHWLCSFGQSYLLQMQCSAFSQHLSSFSEFKRTSTELNFHTFHFKWLLDNFHIRFESPLICSGITQLRNVNVSFYDTLNRIRETPHIFFSIHKLPIKKNEVDDISSKVVRSTASITCQICFGQSQTPLWSSFLRQEFTQLTGLKRAFTEENLEFKSKTLLSTISWLNCFEFSLWCWAFPVSVHWLSSSCPLVCPLKSPPLKIQFVFSHFVVILLKRATFQEPRSHCSAQQLQSLSKLVSFPGPSLLHSQPAVSSTGTAQQTSLILDAALCSLHLIHPTYDPQSRFPSTRSHCCILTTGAFRGILLPISGLKEMEMKRRSHCSQYHLVRRMALPISQPNQTSFRPWRVLSSFTTPRFPHMLSLLLRKLLPWSLHLAHPNLSSSSVLPSLHSFQQTPNLSCPHCTSSP